jgi:tetratricopeptide (TPR) repeat protein
VAPKLLDTDAIDLGHAPDALPGGLKCVFSDKRTVKIGTGTTTQRHTQDVYWYVEQVGPESFGIWMLNDNGVPTGARKTVSKDQLLANYYPELKYYNEYVAPRVREMTGAVHRGDDRRSRSDYEGAQVEYEKALAFDEQNVRAVFGLGLSHLGRGEVDKAQHTFRDLIALEAAFEPEHKHLFNEMAIQLRKNKLFAEAVAFYRRAMDLTENDEHLFYNLARAYYEGGDWAHCLEFLEACLKFRPPLKEALDLLRLAVEMITNAKLRQEHSKPKLTRDEADLAHKLWKPHVR